MAARKKRTVKEERPLEPPMTPMIDVVFQLLIFFILTMKFKQDERELPSRLPKDKGLAAASSSAVEDKEVRIVLCTAEGDERERDQHTTNKGRHEANLEFDEQADIKRTEGGHTGKRYDKAHIVLNDVCIAYVEKNPLGRLYKTWVCKEGAHREEQALDEEKRTAENRQRYREIAAKAKELYDLIPPSPDPAKKAVVKIDADSATPYEHIVGVVNALKELNPPIENIEFTGNPRHDMFYGSEQKGQFDTYREQKQRN